MTKYVSKDNEYYTPKEIVAQVKASMEVVDA